MSTDIGMGDRVDAESSPDSVNPSISSIDLDALNVLIECMEDMGPLSEKRLKQLRDRRSHSLERMLSAAVDRATLGGEASGSFLPAETLSPHHRTVAMDLGAQVAISGRAFSRYIDHGEIPGAASPLRIAIILRIAQRRDLERRFLAAWCKHFANVTGASYAELVNRYRRHGDRHQ